MLKSKKARITLVFALIALLSVSLVPVASAQSIDGCGPRQLYGDLTCSYKCDIKWVVPNISATPVGTNVPPLSVIPFGGSFSVIHKGMMDSIRFRDADGIKGWMEPFAKGTSDTAGPLGWFWAWYFGFLGFETPLWDGIGFFVNQGSDGGHIVEPGAYYVECFGPGGSTGNPQRVILLGPND